MLSRTTTALSTSIPTASISPIIERMLSVRPKKKSSAHADSSEIGMASATTSVAESRRRKKNSTPVARTAPITPDSSSPRSEFSMSSPWSVKVSTWMPASCGSRSISFSTRRAARDTRTVLAPDSLITLSPMARERSRWRP